MKLRFTIRDLLWLTGVVALAVGWWLDHWHWYNEWAVNFHKVEEIKWQVDETLGEINILKGEKSSTQRKASEIGVFNAALMREHSDRTLRAITLPGTWPPR